MIICNKIHKLFTFTWLILSGVFSVYYSYFVIPEMLEKKDSKTVGLYFYTENKKTGEVTYFSNYLSNRKQYNNIIANDNTLFINGCDILPISQKPICSNSESWISMYLEEVGCKKFSSCLKSHYRIQKEEIDSYLDTVTAKEGMEFNLHDDEEISLYNPLSWVNYAKFPLFLFMLYISLKLGKSLREFMFFFSIRG